jgi:hypothetical protein
MPIEFKKDTEAFLAVLSLVIGADQSGSLEERDFLFNKVKGIRIFGNPSAADFSTLLGEVTDALYTNVPNEEGEFTAAGVDALLASVKNALSPDLRQSLVQLAGCASAADVQRSGCTTSAAAGGVFDERRSDRARDRDRRAAGARVVARVGTRVLGRGPGKRGRQCGQGRGDDGGEERHTW